MVQNGYATRGSDGQFILQPGALRKLAVEERLDMAHRLAEKYDQLVKGLQAGDAVTGEYRGTEQLHGGKLAVVLTDYSIVVANVTRTPEIAPGSAVTLERGPGRNAMVRPSAGRALDQGMEAGR